ncbi:hypothetical protein BDP67DRAFT_502207 [Colletotrichum lupini]|nr:hypothetical protein BDP67DRAFT_502207 [Colletotrichum lupini]
MSGLIESIKAHWSRVPCGGCGSVYPKLCFSVRDQRCANRKEVLTIAADCEVAIAERENINDRVEAFKQDEDRLHETLAREDVYIKSLEAAVEEARNRRRKTREEHNTRWADFTKNFDGHRDTFNKSSHLVNRLHEATRRMYALDPRRITDHSLEDHDRSEENKENIGPQREVCSITPPTYLTSDDIRPSEGEWTCMMREGTTKYHAVANWVLATLDAQPEFDRRVGVSDNGQTLSSARRPRRQMSCGQRHRYRPYYSRG